MATQDPDKFYNHLINNERHHNVNTPTLQQARCIGYGIVSFRMFLVISVSNTGPGVVMISKAKYMFKGVHPFS